MKKPSVGQEILMRTESNFIGNTFEKVMVYKVGRKYIEVKPYDDNDELKNLKYKFNLDDGSWTENWKTGSNKLLRTCYIDMQDYKDEVKRFELNYMIKGQFSYKPAHTLEQLEKVAEILGVELDVNEV